MTESLSRIDLPLSDNTDKVAYSMAPMVQHNASTPPYDDFHCTQVVSGHRASSISDEVHDAYANPNYGPCYADEAGLGIPLVSVIQGVGRNILIGTRMGTVGPVQRITMLRPLSPVLLMSRLPR